MGDKKDKREGEKDADSRKVKDVCCEKYLKKGRRCKSCPDSDQPIPPAKDKQE